jgi:hypothetical protein
MHEAPRLTSSIKFLGRRPCVASLARAVRLGSVRAALLPAVRAMAVAPSAAHACALAT